MNVRRPGIHMFRFARMVLVVRSQFGFRFDVSLQACFRNCMWKWRSGNVFVHVDESMSGQQMSLQSVLLPDASQRSVGRRSRPECVGRCPCCSAHRDRQTDVGSQPPKQEAPLRTSSHRPRRYGCVDGVLCWASQQLLVLSWVGARPAAVFVFDWVGLSRRLFLSMSSRN